MSEKPVEQPLTKQIEKLLQQYFGTDAALVRVEVVVDGPDGQVAISWEPRS